MRFSSLLTQEDEHTNSNEKELSFLYDVALREKNNLKVNKNKK